MVDVADKLALWILGGGIVFGLLLIGAGMLIDVEGHTWNECDPDVDPEELDDERQQSELPLG